ncbi:hypothetical protein CYY_005788 [Polysphondylium violaceum]|uniref:Smr domain-containing protein n=1 Tax=Polysphondylium violaceum TaxID=133409 RepID=A0A8J4PSC1_9MYCE|nr:hypothetical protein CYY_005788 [Polysphondylium violaceum]
MGNLIGKTKKGNKAPKAAKAPKASKASTPAPASAPAPAAQAKPQHIDNIAATSTAAAAPATQNQKQSVAPASAAPATTSSSKATTKTIDVDRELHKYVIGTKGVNVKQIKDSTNTEITIPTDSDTITVTGENSNDVDRAIEMIKKIKSEHKTQAQKDQDHKNLVDEHEKESQRTEELYKKNQAEVDKIAQKRQQLFDQAEKEYAAGNKDKARELREEAKAQTALMEEAQKKAARAVFNDKNSKLDKFTIDLHGLQTKDAMELLEERMNSIKGSGKLFTIITGAGNHSDKNGPKIKPLVHQSLKDKGISFEEVNNGSIQCTI